VIHFLHIRKTGGTAIIEALRPVAQSYGIILHTHSTKLKDVPREDRVIFFVRHPISRFVSGFNSRLRQGLPRHHYQWNEAEAEAFRHFHIPNDLAEALSSVDSEVSQRARRAMEGISHIKNTYQTWFCGGIPELDERIASIILIGLQEQLTVDFERLKRILGLPAGVSLPQNDILAHRTPAEFDRYLSPLAESNLERWYAQDLAFYEHCRRLRSERDV